VAARWTSLTVVATIGNSVAADASAPRSGGSPTLDEGFAVGQLQDSSIVKNCISPQ